MWRQRYRHMVPVIALGVGGAGLSLAYFSLQPLLLALYSAAGAFIMYFWLEALNDIHLRKHHETLDAASASEIKEEIKEDVKKAEAAVLPVPDEVAP